MIKIKINQISLNDIIFDTGDRYSCHHELKKIIVKHLELNNDNIVINNYYILRKIVNNSAIDYFYNNDLFFSEKKATNVINDYIKKQNKRKEKCEKEKEIEEKYKEQITRKKLEERYKEKFIMIYKNNEWVKTKCKDIFATNRGIYLVPYSDGHICKLSREGKTWKMWSELEELEIQKRKLEKRISELKLAKKVVE